jgi:general nucleoside transport system ATP-binding protein
LVKRYPGVVANDHIDLTFHSGEIHCLLGENGAGKSTLVALLAGLERPDEGEILVDDRPAKAGSPRASLAAGIGTVFQRPALVPSFTARQNLALALPPAHVSDGPWGMRRGSGGVPGAGGASGGREDMAAVLLEGIEPDAPVRRLALGAQQRVEIAKALLFGTRVLILDEPTSLLDPDWAEKLGSMLLSLCGDATAIIYITHKLDEALRLGDRITILREGRVAGTVAPAEGVVPGALQGSGGGRSEEQSGGLERAILALMFGRESGSDPMRVARRPAAEEAPPGTGALLELRGVRVKRTQAGSGFEGRTGLFGVDLAVHPGQVLGIAGIEGNGQRELAEVIAGQRRPDSGEVLFEGHPINSMSVRERYRRGIRYVTDDRWGEGVAPDESIAVNLLLKSIGRPPFWRRGWRDRQAIEGHAEGLISSFDIRTTGPRQAGATLSGGNLQKVVLARELSAGARLVVFNKPTHGLDARSASASRERILALARAGSAAVLISHDLDELLGLCDRIAVMLDGRITALVERGPETERRLVRALSRGDGG